MNLKEHIRKVLKEETNSSDMKTVQSELMNMFGGRIKIVNIKIGSYGSTFNVVFDNLDQEILNKINQFMTSKSWFPTNIGFSGLKGRIYSQNVNDYLDEDDVQISYEAHLPEAIKVNQTKAYHVTPDIFFNQINEKGLVPKSESKLSNHPDRVYLYRNQDEHNSIVWALWNSLSKERQKTIKNYYVLEIDLTQIPNHQFFNDPQAMANYGAIYTTQPIPKSAIKVIGKIGTKDIETKDEVEMTKNQEKIASNELKQKEKERLDLEKKQEKSDLEDAESRKKFDELPDNLKNMDINDLLSLEEQIIKVLKEEASFILSGDRYINLIKKVVLDYVDFDICKLVVDKLENTKDQYYVIMIVEKPLRSDYREKLQDFLNEVIPLTIYVSIADGMNCKTYMKVEHPKQVSESKVPSQVLRRHNLIDDLFTTVRSRFSKRICDYRHPDHFLDTLYERVLEDLYHAWFYETVTDDEWDVASKYIEHYLTKKYKKSTVMFWENECDKKSSLRKKEETEGFSGYAAPAFEMKPDHVHFKHQYNEESEITERCWKGYTQKGMKTMFGKRYPNCVKKTK
jgi:hypothetical protein